MIINLTNILPTRAESLAYPALAWKNSITVLEKKVWNFAPLLLFCGVKCVDKKVLVVSCPRWINPTFWTALVFALGLEG